MESKRQWGPFNGRQLTTIFVALVIGVVAIPTAGYATTLITKVQIKDAFSNSLARVSSDGALKVGDGAGPLTVDGTVAVNGPVAVTGNLTAQDPIQSGQYFHRAVHISDGAASDLSPPSGKDLIVTSIQIAANFVVEPFAAGIVIPRWVTIFADPGVPASEEEIVIANESPSTIGTTVLPFVPGVLIPEGGQLSINSLEVEGWVIVFGYLVPAA